MAWELWVNSQRWAHHTALCPLPSSSGAGESGSLSYLPRRREARFPSLSRGLRYSSDGAVGAPSYPLPVLSALQELHPLGPAEQHFQCLSFSVT